MNKKSTIVSIVLIALMSLALIPATRAFQTGPGGSPANTTYNEYGPAASQLIMNVYTDYASMFAAFHSKAIDFLDGPLLPTDYATISTDTDFTTGAVLEFGLRQFDLNHYVAPFNNVFFRQGLSSLIDRLQWMSLYFPSGGLPAYSVLQCDGSWADPALGPPPYYPQDFAQAYLDFCLAYGAPIPDPLRPGYSTWSFPNPYPTSADNPNPTAYDGTGPGIGQNQILFYIRTEQTERRDSGIYLVDEAENQFPAWAAANPGNPVFATYPLPVVGGVPQLPALNFYNHGVLTTSATTSHQVMWFMRFQLYTGGWSTGSTPDFMDVWREEYAPAWNGNWGHNPYNYGNFVDDEFSQDVNNCETALVIDPPTTYGTAKYWAYAAQERMMSLVAVIPWWIYSGYTATLTTDYNAVNALGVGFGTWWSFFDAYPTAGSPGFGTNSITWGWQSDVHENCNPISATWVWDWNLIAEIYDSMEAGNPYDTATFRPGLADAFNVVLDPGTTGWAHTVMTSHLREDVFWQDVPSKIRNAYTVDGGSELNGPITNVPLTVLDVAFTYVMARDFGKYAAVHINPDAADVDHVEVSSIWAPLWPYTVNDPPWFNSTYAVEQGGTAWDTNFVQFNPTFDAETIKIYLTDDLTWLAYYTDLAIPILPLHIFGHLAEGGWMNNGVAVPDVFSMNLSPLGGADLLYGTGPYIWLTGTPGSSYTMIAYAQGANYRGITEQNSYFWLPIRVPDSQFYGEMDTETIGKGGSLSFTNGLQNLLPATTAAQVYFDYTVSWSGPNSGSATGVSPTMNLNLAPGVTTITQTVYILPSAACVAGETIKVSDSLHVIFTWSGRSYHGTYGDFGYPAGVYSDVFLVNGPAPINVDINGDGIIDISDGAQIGLNWFKNVPPAPANVDINRDGIIDISDGAQIGLNWFKHADWIEIVSY